MITSGYNDLNLISFSHLVKRDDALTEEGSSPSKVLSLAIFRLENPTFVVIHNDAL